MMRLPNHSKAISPRSKDWLGKQPNIATYYVDYNRLLREPIPEVHQINRFLGGNLDETLMLAAIDPKLYRQRK